MTGTGRRRVRAQLIDKAEREDIGLICDDGPVLSGTDDESVICARCERTLLLGVSRQNACRTFIRGLGGPIASAGTAAENKPFPLIVECDCGAINRIWPIIPL